MYRIMKQQKVDADFPNKILFSNEAYFHLYGFGYRQNVCLWSSKNSQVMVEKQMHRQAVTV